jgi:hypothetical protein
VDSRAASTDIIDIEDRIVARMAREKLRQTMRQDQNNGKDQGDDGFDSAKCNLNIGNSFNKKRIGGKTEITVVVTGPVIQANNKCR